MPSPPTHTHTISSVTCRSNLAVTYTLLKRFNLSSVLQKNTLRHLPRGRAGCTMGGNRRESVINVSKSVLLGFTANPTGGACRVGGERGFLGLEGSW